MKGIKYKDTIAGKGSALAEAIAESPAAAKKVYDETTARFDAMYPGAKADRLWFLLFPHPPAGADVPKTQLEAA